MNKLVMELKGMVVERCKNVKMSFTDRTRERIRQLIGNGHPNN